MNNFLSKKYMAKSAMTLFMLTPAFTKIYGNNVQVVDKKSDLIAYAANPAALKDASLDEDFIALNVLTGFKQKLAETESSLIEKLKPYTKGSKRHTAAKKAIAPVTPYQYCANGQKNSISKTLIDSLDINPEIARKVQNLLTDHSFSSFYNVKSMYPECVFQGTVYSSEDAYYDAMDTFVLKNRRTGTDEEYSSLTNEFMRTAIMINPDEPVYCVTQRKGYTERNKKGHAILLVDGLQYSFNRDYIAAIPRKIETASIIFLEQMLELIIQDEIRNIKMMSEDQLKQRLIKSSDNNPLIENTIMNMERLDLVRLNIICLFGKKIYETKSAPTKKSNIADLDKYARDYTNALQKKSISRIVNSRIYS